MWKCCDTEVPIVVVVLAEERAARERFNCS